MSEVVQSLSSKAPNPSYVTLPDCSSPYPTLLEFLEKRFPKVGREVWRSRLENAKITTDAGEPIDINSLYCPNLRLRYYREVEQEPIIPFYEKILFCNNHFLIVDKPHFLPVTPSGPYVNQCLLYRLKVKTGFEDLVPIHRIDRETAGLVMFSRDKNTRGIYHNLFCSGKVQKEYKAIATLPIDQEQDHWFIKNRIVQGEPWFRVKQGDGVINALSEIVLLKRQGNYGYFRLKPLTGKQHQLRLHMSIIGSQILYDRYYPTLQPKRPDNFTKPLQLLAQKLGFVDPITQKVMTFQSPRKLLNENSLG